MAPRTHNRGIGGNAEKPSNFHMFKNPAGQFQLVHPVDGAEGPPGSDQEDQKTGRSSWNSAFVGRHQVGSSIAGFLFFCWADLSLFFFDDVEFKTSISRLSGAHTARLGLKEFHHRYSVHRYPTSTKLGDADCY